MNRATTEQNQADKTEQTAFEKALKEKELEVTNWDFEQKKAAKDEVATAKTSFDAAYREMMSSADPYQWLQTNRAKIGYDNYATLSGLVQPPEDNTFELIYQSMMSSKDPYSWLQNNRASVGYDNFVKLSKVVDEPNNNRDQELFNEAYALMMNSESPADWLEANKAAVGYDNYIKLGKLVDSPQKSGSVFTADDYFRRINDLMQPDKDGNVNFTDEQAIDMLLNSPLEGNEVDEVAQLLGIYEKLKQVEQDLLYNYNANSNAVDRARHGGTK